MERPIKIHEGTFYYSKHKVFQNLNIEIPAQKVTCILGESGAGKTKHPIVKKQPRGLPAS